MIIGSDFMKLSQQLGEKVSGKIFGNEFKDFARKRPEDFTRTRGMGFEELMLHILTALKCSTVASLRRFFLNIGATSCVCVAQQSYSEARYKIRVDAFVDLFKTSVTTMLENTTKTWHGYRILAIDGSKIALPSDKKLLAYFGGLGKDKTAPTAQGSILYDVLNDIIVEALLHPMKSDERTLAIKHLKKYVKIAPGKKNLIIFDRGYPSFELIEFLESMGFTYVMRVRSKFNNDIDSQTTTDGFVWLKQGDNRIRVRVIKFMLDSGEEEVLLTNLNDKRLGKSAFKKLYFMRWPVETKYDIVKNKLQLENFNTRKVEGIQQDFYATMFLANFAAACAIDVQEEIDKERNTKGNKYQQKANMNELIGILKDRLVLALIQDTPEEQAGMIESILDEIRRHTIPIKPERSTPRNKSPKTRKHQHNQKSNC
jgi:hypothetical protein